MSNDADDPFKPRDPTMLRPRPGAGKRGAADVRPVAPSISQAPTPGLREPQLPPVREVAAPGLNPLVQAANALLLIAANLRGTLSMNDIESLRSKILDEIRRFEERARNAGVANEVVLAARYVLCATLDESVLATPWGAQSDWGQRTLLVALHRETWGGEKFFDMLDRLSTDPARHIDLMELQYLCMAFGFGGKYQAQARGQTQLAELQQELYRKIRAFRGVSEPELSLRWRGLQDRRNPIIRYVPWWVVGAAALVIVMVAFIYFHTRLDRTSDPVQQELARVGVEDFAAPAEAVAAAGPTLKQLLAADEASGSLSVEEQGGKTLITLIAPGLFASASTAVNPAFYETLRHVAAAIEQVPGRVLVVGHTDDQPVRSMRYHDNFELSRERAVSVVKVLQLATADQSRFQWTGVGSSQPRYKPESLPENRARNRRVEIVHVAGAPGVSTRS
jgi:type VI secretion system protein ImpK